jgi:hypothetical protein
MRLNITKAKWMTFSGSLALFYLLNLLAGTANEDFGRTLITAFATPLGPTTGAISRDFQDCCLQFSLRLMPYFLPFPVLAVAFQFGVPPQEKKGIRLIRSLAWTLGWIGWFFGGIVSFGHALS